MPFILIASLTIPLASSCIIIPYLGHKLRESDYMDPSPRRRQRQDSRSSPAKRRNLFSCTTTAAVLSSCSTNGTTKSDINLHEPNANTIVPVPLLSRFDDLTDDTLLEIFLLLPVKTLHRFMCVSKRWLSLISAPSFARSYILVHPVNNILFFKIVCYARGAVGQVFGVPVLHDDMNKVSSSLSGSLPPFSSDFVPALNPVHYDYHSGFSPKGVTERLLVDVFFMGDSAGLILLKGVYQDRTDATRYYDNKQYYIYYVCNPVTKKWVGLPSISTLDIVGLTCYYQQEDKRGEKITRIWGNTSTPGDIIKQSDSYNPNKIEYTVVSINKAEVANVFIVRVFSSTQQTPEWRIFRVPIPHGYKWRGTDGLHRVLFSNGKFHWTGETCIAAYDPFNKPHQCDIIPLPPMDFPRIDDTYLFTTYEGRIRLGTPFYTRRCSVWELADYANKLWVKKYEVNVDPLLPADLQCFVLGSAGEKAYMVSDEPKDAIMIFDMRNASLQHVYTYPSCPDNNYCGNQFFMWCLNSYVSSPWPTPVPLLPPCERPHEVQPMSM